jgi:hypothetical protein
MWDTIRDRTNAHQNMSSAEEKCLYKLCSGIRRMERMGNRARVYVEPIRRMLGSAFYEHVVRHARSEVQLQDWYKWINQHEASWKPIYETLGSGYDLHHEQLQQYNELERIVTILLSRPNWRARGYLQRIERKVGTGLYQRITSSHSSASSSSTSSSASST